MSNNRPRPSVLNFFDPLANSSETPSTPRCGAPPRDNENQKNSADNLTLTTFFNKTYKPILDPPPVPLKRRLIDIGDMTLEDAASPGILLDPTLEGGISASLAQVADEEENATLTFRDMAKAATPNKAFKSTPHKFSHKTPPTLQTPHIGIVVGSATPTPHPTVSNDLIIPETSSKRTTSNVLEECVPMGPPENVQNKLESPIQTEQQEAHLKPEDSQLFPSPVISPRELAAAEPPQPPTISLELVEPTDPLLANPQILTVPQTPDSAVPTLLEPNSVASDSAGATLRPNPPNTSSQDLHRASVDLHASFQMHLQSEDMSFDLLSDKASLFNPQNGMVSFLTTIEDDASFDMETERDNMERALKTYPGDTGRVHKANDSPSTSASSSAPVTPIDAPSTPSMLAQQSFDAPIVTGSILKTVRKRLSIPIPISSPRLIGHPSPLTGTNPPSQLAPFSPSEGVALKRVSSSRSVVPSASLIATRRTSLPFATPKPSKDQSALLAPPLAVPALKIVKRSRPKGHERTDSTSVSSGSLEPRNPPALTAPPARVYELPAVAPLKTRHPVKEQEALQTLNEMEPQVPRRLAKQTRPLVPPRPPVSTEPAETAGQGPRRVPISEGPQLRSAAIPRAVGSSVPVTGGPRRVPYPAPTLPTSQARSAIAGPSGLKAPTQFSATVLNMTSSLPKPASRTSAIASRLPALKTLKPGRLPTLRRAT